MAHPLYNQVLPHMNKQLTVHHIDGNRYFGTLQRVTPDGLYLSPVNGRTVSGSKNKGECVKTAEMNADQKVEANEVFFAPFFFPFATLAGFTLGFAAGATRAYYPPYPYYAPYPYYRPYPYRRFYW